MIHICPRRYLKHSSKKLFTKANGVFHIICKFELNAYLHDLSHDMNISPIFNVKDTWTYRGILSLLFY